MQDTATGAGPSRLDEVFKSIVDRAGAKLVYGEPVVAGDKTILPVARIRYGFGGGSGGRREGQGGGGGGGLVAVPVGVVEVGPSGTRFIPVTPGRTVAAAIALGMFLGFVMTRKRRR